MRMIDADELKNQVRHMPRTVNPDLVQYSLVQSIIENMPTLTPPNEPMLERVVREYLEICGNDCAGDPSVGIPECPFYQYADVLDNGALIQPKCELAAYRRPPEGEV